MPVEFKAPHLFDELERCHPELQAVLSDLAAWCHSQGMPPVVVTHVLRTPDFQEATYTPLYLKAGLPAAEAREKARAKFSWHLVGCAADIRNRHLSTEERKRVMAWLSGRCTKGPWEVLEHDVGRGDHIHVGRRCFKWREAWARPKET